MFGVDLDTPLTEEQINETADAIARKIIARGLETPAVMFLEMHKPLASIAGQGLLVTMPFLGPFVGPQRVADFSKLIRDRANIELLIARIEDMAAARDDEGRPMEGQS